MRKIRPKDKVFYHGVIGIMTSTGYLAVEPGSFPDEEHVYGHEIVRELRELKLNPETLRVIYVGTENSGLTPVAYMCREYDVDKTLIEEE